jgi:hypothetical protein
MSFPLRQLGARSDGIAQLLRKNPGSRLRDISEIKEHPFFEKMYV